jgi:hypothetical protein
MVKLAAIVSALVALGAGLYLVTLQSQAPGTTIFEAMAHGIGAYFIAKALFIGSSLWQQDDATSRLGTLVEFAAARHVRESGEAGRDDYSGLPPA